MAEFLSHLIQRSQQDAAVLRPRPVSRFEPVGPMSALPAPDEPGADSSAPAVTGDSDRPAIRAAAPAPSTLVVPDAPPHPLTPPRRTPDPAVAEADFDVTTPRPITVAPRLRPLPVDAGHPDDLRASDQQLGRGEPLEAPTQAAQIQPRPVPPPAPDGDRAIPISPRLARDSERAAAAARILPRPPVMPPPPEEPHEPTVHITIGRIEVTAAPPPAPTPPRQRPRAAVLTLDDYLKQREKERRP